MFHTLLSKVHVHVADQTLFDLLHALHPAGNQQDDEEEPDLQQFLQQPGTRAHKRGTSPFVFVQWDHIGGSDLNLPVGKMDFYVPG